METGQTTHCGNKKTLIVYFFSKCYLNQKIKLMLYLRSQYNSNRSHELIRKIFIWIQKQVYFRQSFRTNRINFAAKRVALCWPLEWSQVNVLASLFWPTSNIHILYIVCGHKLPVWYIFFLHVSVPQITKKLCSLWRKISLYASLQFVEEMILIIVIIECFRVFVTVPKSVNRLHVFSLWRLGEQPPAVLQPTICAAAHIG